MGREPALFYLARESESSRSVYWSLRTKYGPFPALIERGPSRVAIVRRRAKRNGWRHAIGQAAFVVVVVPWLRHRSQHRINEIRLEHRLDPSPFPAEVTRVDSVNSDPAREWLRAKAEGVGIVNGTQILDRATLDCVQVPLINLHAGITPAYRGVHGGYWALREGRPDLVGSTVHIVDQGIDTGTVLRQKLFQVTTDDNFATYPYLHNAASIEALHSVLEDWHRTGALSPTRPLAGRAPLRTHPTLFEYLRARKAGVP